MMRFVRNGSLRDYRQYIRTPAQCLIHSLQQNEDSSFPWDDAIGLIG